VFSRISPKPFRRRLILGWYSTLLEQLRGHVAAGARRQGVPCPADESTGFYRIASIEAPALLDRVRHLRSLLGS